MAGRPTPVARRYVREARGHNRFLEERDVGFEREQEVPRLGVGAGVTGMIHVPTDDPHAASRREG
jgi:hypothetical protein